MKSWARVISPSLSLRQNSVQHEMVELQCFFLCEALPSLRPLRFEKITAKDAECTQSFAKDVMHVVETNPRLPQTIEFVVSVQPCIWRKRVHFQ